MPERFKGLTSRHYTSSPQGGAPRQEVEANRWDLPTGLNL